MSIKCRLCGSPISSSPLLELNNMPKSAQSFVKEDELDSEKGVDIILEALVEREPRSATAHNERAKL